jgi:hypothetical protein
MGRELWTREELLMCLAYYSSSPSPKVFSREQIKELSGLLQRRSSDSVSLRLANFIARDSDMTKLGYLGMSGGGQKVDNIWSEFSDQQGHLDQGAITLAILKLANPDGC